MSRTRGQKVRILLVPSCREEKRVMFFPVCVDMLQSYRLAGDRTPSVITVRGRDGVTRWTDLEKHHVTYKLPSTRDRGEATETLLDRFRARVQNDFSGEGRLKSKHFFFLVGT